MKSNSISLCMIVRDEAKFLGRCLESAKEVFDELIVVDTGSKDESVSIAEKYGARVFHQNWNDDFSQPRNLSLSYASGKWVLMLDADEELSEGAALAIRELVKDPLAAAYELRMVNVNEAGLHRDEIYALRLFRNHPLVRFEGIIHESVVASVIRLARQEEMQIHRADVTLLHYGYRKEIEISKKKKERNERLFKKQLALTPDNAYAWYKYADSLRSSDRQKSDEAISKSFAALQKLSDEEARMQIYGAEVCAFYAHYLWNQQRGKQALELIETVGRRFIPTPNLYYIEACIALREGQAARAIAGFEKCLSYRGKALSVPVQPGITGPIAFFGIGEAHRALGNLQEAENAYLRALKELPGYPQAEQALQEVRTQQRTKKN